MTAVAAAAAKLLEVNGVAWGPQVATGTQISVAAAFEQAGVLPGDAAVVEQEWLRQATRDGVFDGDVTLESQVRHIGSVTVTNDDLAAHLGPAWQEVLYVVGTVAALGFDAFVDRVRASPPMRSSDALATKSALRERAATLGRASQWAGAQEIVTVYFEHCTFTALTERPNDVPATEYTRGWDLAEVLVRDAVAAAALSDLEGEDDRSGAATLAQGLRIVLAPEGLPRDESLTTAVDPNENMDPLDVELLDLEDPIVDGG